MKISSVILLILLSSSIIPVLAQNGQDAIREKAAADIVSNMARKAYADVTKDFAGSLKSQLLPDKIKEVWEGLIAQIGAFDKVISTTPANVQGYNQIKKRCKFASDNMNVEVTFNDDNKVIGLYIKP